MYVFEKSLLPCFPTVIPFFSVLPLFLTLLALLILLLLVLLLLVLLLLVLLLLLLLLFLLLLLPPPSSSSSFPSFFVITSEYGYSIRALQQCDETGPRVCPATRYDKQSADKDRFNSYTQNICIDNAVTFEPAKNLGNHNHATEAYDPEDQRQIVTYSSQFVDKLSDVVEATNLSPSTSIKTGSIGNSGKGGGGFIDCDKVRSVALPREGWREAGLTEGSSKRPTSTT